MDEERDADTELKLLVENLGLSESEALKVLGLQPQDEMTPPDEVVQLTNEEELEILLMEMFPTIQKSIIQDALVETGGSVEASSDILLNHELVVTAERDAGNDVSEAKERKWAKQERKKRKFNTKNNKLVENEEKDIEILVNGLDISEEEARQLYWTNGNSVAAVMQIKGPQIPLTTRMEMEKMLRWKTKPVNFASATNLQTFMSMDKARVQEQKEKKEQRLQFLIQKQKSGKPAQGAISSLVSMEAWNLKQDIRSMDLALKTIYTLGKSSSSHIDLHGCTLEEAKAIAVEAVSAFKTSGLPEIEIVSGAGRHSKNGVAVIKQWLRTYLRQQNLKVSETEGSFVVRHRIRI